MHIKAGHYGIWEWPERLSERDTKNKKVISKILHIKTSTDFLTILEARRELEKTSKFWGINCFLSKNLNSTKLSLKCEGKKNLYIKI